MNGRRSLTREERGIRYRRGSGIKTESVNSGFFVGGHVGVKSERECGHGWRKKRWMDRCRQQGDTGQNAALASTESQQFAAPD